MEEKNKKQVLRYSDEELNLIKSVFADNDNSLKALQKVFLQIPLNAIDLSIINGWSKDLKKLLRKVFVPELNDDVPLTQVWDLTSSIDFKGKMMDEVVLNIKANKILLDYFNQQLKALDKNDFKAPKITIEELTNIDNKTDWQIYIDILARSNIIGTTQSRVLMLMTLAGKKDETPEERDKRLIKDSTK